MKRIILVLFLILSLLICLTSCPEEIKEENSQFAKFNEMFAKTYDNYTIAVFTLTFDGAYLDNNYNVTTVDGVTYVEYHVETLNEFVIEGDTISIPDGYKTVTKGVYNSISDAEIVDSYKVPQFNFSASCLNSVKIGDTLLTANVKSLADFMGLNVNCINATVQVEYQDDILYYIDIVYETESGNTVFMTYTFNEPLHLYD